MKSALCMCRHVVTMAGAGQVPLVQLGTVAWLHRAILSAAPRMGVLVGNPATREVGRVIPRYVLPYIYVSVSTSTINHKNGCFLGKKNKNEKKSAALRKHPLKM